MPVLSIALRVALLLGLAALALPGPAQQTGKVHRLGVLGDTTRSEATENRWRSTLRKWGYVEGQNLTLHFAWAEERPERLSGLTTELVRSNVEIILANSTQSVVAAKRITTTIPIVTMSGDPVGAGLVDSIARPGGNVTGVFLPFSDLAAKRLQLLKEIVPALKSVAIVFNPSNPAAVTQLRSAEAAARGMNMLTYALDLRTQADLNTVVAAAAAKKVGALIVMQDPVAFRAIGKLAELAARHRLPASHAYSQFPDAGGLMSYGVNLADAYMHSASYVDRLLKGAKAADLAMEQPAKFELVLNLRTAKALGLTFPSSLLLRADRIVE